jgi:Ser/Thr protein kinase RdoA (MazF antagonist)
MPLLGGSATAIVDDVVWESVSYLPGRTVGWKRQPKLGEIGAFMARFHEASERSAIEQRVGHNIPITALTVETTWSDLDVDEKQAGIVRRSSDELDAGLARIDHTAAPLTVIHGDLTNHNLLACGQPLSPSGLIDFSNAYSEVVLADIGFGLWRSGRQSQKAHTYDPARIAAILTGYRTRRSVTPDDVDAVIVYLRARGLQIAAKQARQHQAVDGPLVARLLWLHDHADDLRRDVARRLLER